MMGDELMKATRRGFITGAVASVCAMGTGAKTSRAEEGETAGEDRSAGAGCLDYGLSFICNPSPANSVRFWVESRTTIIDDAAGVSTEFYQCGSCKSENTFGEKDLLVKDNYDFLPILGDGYWLVFRRPARLSDRYRQVTPAEEIWGEPIPKLRHAKSVRVLDTWEEIRDATAAAVPIVTQTEIADSSTGLRAIIECPVKTMNVSLTGKMYQVDTGPIAFPDLTQRYDPLIDCLRLAFIVFNAPDFADFVIEQPTPVIEDGKELCKIYHYSNPFSLPAKNTVLAAGVVE